MTKSLKKVMILKGFCCFSCYWTISVFNSVKKQKKQKNPLKNHYFQGILLFLLFLDTFGLLLAESCRHEAMHEKCTLPTIPLGPAGQGLYLKKIWQISLTNISQKEDVLVKFISYSYRHLWSLLVKLIERWRIYSKTWISLNGSGHWVQRGCIHSVLLQITRVHGGLIKCTCQTLDS